MPPKVSVLIPAYNAAPHIREAVDSVLHQTFQDYEVIVLDDGSTDETAAVLKTYGERVRVLTQPNRGRAQARNALMAAACGDYIAWLDADDRWMAERLERGAAYLDAHSEIGLVHGYVRAVGENGAVVEKEDRRIRALQRLETLRGSGTSRLLTACAIYSSAVIFRRCCLEDVGEYDPGLLIYEDYEWYLRFSLHYPMAILGEPPLAAYRCHEANVAVHWPQEEIAENYLAILEGFQKSLAEHAAGARYRRLLSQVLAKKAEFQWTLRRRSEMRASAWQALQLRPAQIFNWNILKRLLQSVAP